MQAASGAVGGHDETEAGPEAEFTDGERPRRVGRTRFELRRRKEYPLHLGRTVGVVVDIAEGA